MAACIKLLLLAACAATCTHGVLATAGPAAIIAFNNEAQAAVREYGIQSQIASRIYAIVHVSQHKAIKSDNPALQSAQAAYAGHTALSLLFPWRFAKLDKALQPLVESLTSKQKKDAQEAGQAAAIAVVRNFNTDGFASYVPFTPEPAGGRPGKYQFAPNQTYSVYPQIATTRPLVLKSVNKFKPAAPLKLQSKAYAEQLGEVFDFGKKASEERTQEQTETAWFWADGNTTSAVAGHFNQIAQVLLPASASPKQAARVFAILNAAAWDASIAAYRAKYANPSWRPITAIRQGDGSKATAAFVDAEWTPLLNTPSHPEHPSGHSATAAASAAVIDRLLGSNKSFTIGTEYPGLPPRTYKNIQEAVSEVNWSRVYGGVHFRHAVVEGAALGAKVAAAVIQQF